MNNKWILEQLHVAKSWEEIDSSLSDIKVAFLDTGCNSNIEYLNNIDLDCIDFKGQKNSEDESGHGTFFAGIIKQFIPIDKCGSPKLISINVVEEGKIHIKNIIKGINLAIELGVDVLNIGACNGYYNEELANVLYKAYKEKILLVSPAGNKIRGFSSYPASLDTVISCGSSNMDNDIAKHSNYNKSIDIFAPGENIYSCLSQGKEFEVLSGTSFSAAIITALGILAKSKSKNIDTDIFRKALNNSKIDIGYEIKHSRIKYTRKLVDFNLTLRNIKINDLLGEIHKEENMHLKVMPYKDSFANGWIATMYDSFGRRRYFNVGSIIIELVKCGKLIERIEKKVLNGELKWKFNTKNLDGCFIKISYENNEFDSILIML